MRKTLAPLFVVITAAGCGTTTASKPAAMPKPDQQTLAVKASARQMYRMFIRADADGFCRFVDAASIQELAGQFKKSGLSSRQICMVISAAALKNFLQDPEGRARLADSLQAVDDSEIVVKGNKAWMGDREHNTMFQKSGGKWRPVMPRFAIPDQLSGFDNDLVQA